MLSRATLKIFNARGLTAVLGILSGTVTGLALTDPALASPATDMTTQRIAAISAGDVTSLTAAYGSPAVLQWVGGPLDGVYSDAAAINATWTKFTRAQGKLKTDIVAMNEAANPQGSTVATDLVLTGAKPLKVHYVTVWRAGKLVDEIWQINPNASY